MYTHSIIILGTRRPGIAGRHSGSGCKGSSRVQVGGGRNLNYLTCAQQHSWGCVSRVRFAGNQSHRRQEGGHIQG